jgi:putative membrane protein
MKLIYKGKFEDYDSLPKADLPKNAIKFDEPETIEGIVQEAKRYFVPLLVIIGDVIIFKWIFMQTFSLDFLGLALGLFLTLPFLVVHELLHALSFPLKTEVYLYQALKKGVLFVTSTAPLKKSRFIIMSLLPMVVLGLIPLFWWIFILDSFYSSLVLGLSVPMLLGGAGDLYNVVNTLCQVPRGAFIQLSGINSYWYLEEKEEC